MKQSFEQNQVNCEECGEYIGHIDKSYYSNYLDLILCDKCLKELKKKYGKEV